MKKELSIKNLPNLKDLARKSREETIPVSLRVKERTYAVFSGLAEQYNTTAGAMINRLIDIYADKNNETDSEDLIVKNYILRFASKIANCNEMELAMLLSDYASEVHFKKSTYHKEDAKALVEALAAIARSRRTTLPEDADLPDITLSGYFAPTIRAMYGKEARFYKDFDGQWYFVEIPAKKWLLVANIFNAYDKKRNRVYDDAETFMIEEAVWERIVGVINETDNMKLLAKKVAEELVKHSNVDGENLDETAFVE